MAENIQKFVRLPNVLERIGLSRSQLYRLIERGQFPNSVQLGERSVGWVSAEIDDWIDSRIAARRQVRPTPTEAT